IEHTNDTGLACMEHDVGDAEIAMTKRDGFAFRQTLGEPTYHTVERRVIIVAATEFCPLLRPALQLAGKIVPGPAEITQSQRPVIQPVDGGQRGAHRAEELGALCARESGRAELVEDAAVQPFHEIE